MHYIRVGLIYKPHDLFAGNFERCATFLRTFFNRCESEIDVAPNQVYFLHKRRGVGPLCHPMPSWICVDTLIPCPGVVDKEGTDTVGVHSLQTFTFRMMITTTHFFCGIKERAHVFIPLEFKHRRCKVLLSVPLVVHNVLCGVGECCERCLWNRPGSYVLSQ